MAAKTEKVQSGPGLGSLLAWIIIPAAVWAVQMQLNYVLIAIECTTKGRSLLIAVWLIAVLLILLSAFISWRNWQQVGVQFPDVKDGLKDRTRFMSALALLLSGMFFLVIVAQGLATIVFHPCQL